MKKKISWTDDVARRAKQNLRALRGENQMAAPVGSPLPDRTACTRCGYLSCDCDDLRRAAKVVFPRFIDYLPQPQVALDRVGTVGIGGRSTGERPETITDALKRLYKNQKNVVFEYDSRSDITRVLVNGLRATGWRESYERGFNEKVIDQRALRHQRAIDAHLGVMPLSEEMKMLAALVGGDRLVITKFSMPYGGGNVQYVGSVDGHAVVTWTAYTEFSPRREHASRDQGVWLVRERISRALVKFYYHKPLPLSVSIEKMLKAMSERQKENLEQKGVGVEDIRVEHNGCWDLYVGNTIVATWDEREEANHMERASRARVTGALWDYLNKRRPVERPVVAGLSTDRLPEPKHVPQLDSKLSHGQREEIERKQFYRDTINTYLQADSAYAQALMQRKREGWVRNGLIRAAVFDEAHHMSAEDLAESLGRPDIVKLLKGLDESEVIVDKMRTNGMTIHPDSVKAAREDLDKFYGKEEQPSAEPKEKS